MEIGIAALAEALDESTSRIRKISGVLHRDNTFVLSIGRFINVDSYVSTGQGILGYNIFAYCLNNLVCRKDVSGTYSVAIFDDDFDPTDDFKDIAGGKMGGLSNTSGKGVGSGGKSGSTSGLKINQLPLAKPGEDLYVGTYSKSSYWNKKTGLNKTKR